MFMYKSKKKEFHLVSLTRSYTYFPPSPKEGEQVISRSQIWQRYTELLSHTDLEIFVVWVHTAL